MTDIPANATALKPDEDRSRIWIISLLVALIVLRVLLQVVLYRSGFLSLSADEFGRTFFAARWSQTGETYWYGPWLPFHMYLYGAALSLWGDMVWMPRLVTILMGAISIVFMYLFARDLFEDRKIGLLSAALLAVNPAHVWLSSTPLTAIAQTMLVLGFMWSFTVYLKSEKRSNLYLSAAMLALGNGFRFESWIISLIFSLTVVIKGAVHFRRAGLSLAEARDLLLAAFIPWVFPLVWIAGNYLETGDPFFFLGSVRSYKATWYGDRTSYRRYWEAFTTIDPYLTILGLVGMLVCVLRAKRSRSVLIYAAVAVFSFAIYLYLHGGQIEPPGNYIRYFALFLFLFYPALGYLIYWGTGLVAKNRVVRIALLLLVLGLVVTTQTRTTFAYQNDPAAEGLPVGLRIKELRAGSADLAGRPVLIELSYWQYIAIHIGANDISRIVYDRELDTEQRETLSLLETDLEAFRACLRGYDISYVVLRSGALRKVIQQELGLRPSEKVGQYVFYQVPDELVQDDPGSQAVCPLGFGTGY